jgi:hypothetical protein
MYNPQTGEVLEAQAAVAPPVPPAPAPAPVAAPTPMPMAAPGPPVPAAQAVPSYGAVDVGAMGQDSKSVFSGGGKRIYINMPTTPSNVGESASIPVRLLPPWTPNRSFAHVKYAEHRLNASLVPDGGKRTIAYATCYDSEGGPGHCPICEVLKKDTTGDLSQYKPKGKYMWQALQLDNLNQHFRQRMDEATQQPVVQPDGSPVWDIVPGLVRMPPTLHRAITMFFEKKGDATHPQTGYAMELIKTKKGAGTMEVEYSAMDTNPSPLDPQLMPALANLIDLQSQIHFYSQPEMELIARNILGTTVSAAAPAPVPAPGAAYAAPLVGVPAAPPAATPAPPPQMVPPPPAVAPPAPQAAPPVPAAPQAAPAAYPPPVAPGGIPAAPPQAHPNVPPAPAPAPGLPPGMVPPPPAAPEGGEPQASGLSPEQFEQTLLGENSGQTPF